MVITSKIIINKPVKEVWDFFNNPDNMHLWLTDFKRFEPISGELGKVGAKAKHIYENRGKDFEMTEEITKRDEYKNFSGILRHKSMESTIETNFEDLNHSRTSLTCLVNVEFKSLFLKIFGGLMRNSFQKRQDKDFKTLKSVIESR